ncbi:methyltransferase domain-containing protein [Streptomyces sp. NBC_01136]|uniref:class I SAM-dependent methyltransferase n=1 Tax=unclassified Streptomyces TaxID=2593676 RepID=UPI00324BE41B|nr:methyltransferase domain-containing protein [Streptomyces sp. NBC_01136]
MFTPQGPTLRELAVQALSSVEHGYDLLAPKFDHTPFRTPDSIQGAVARALGPIGPFDRGLDLCCGTGAGMEVLRGLCRVGVTGVDISAGMLAVGRERMGTGEPKRTETGAPGGARPGGRLRPRPGAHAGTSSGGGERGPATPGGQENTSPGAHDAHGAAGSRPRATADSRGPEVRGSDAAPHVAWVRGDARALPFGPVFDLVVSFGAFGHFLPCELPGLFAQVHSTLRPGGRFVFPMTAPPRPSSPWYWALLGFDAAMRVRNTVWRPPFVMYYRAFRLADVQRELTRAGFEVELHALPEFGWRRDGSPRCRMVVATRRGGSRRRTRS